MSIVLIVLEFTRARDNLCAGDNACASHQFERSVGVGEAVPTLVGLR